MKKILITGPESSGKTSLAIALSKALNASLIAEYAREYLSDRTGYTLEDLTQIASEQYQREKSSSISSDWLICDTGPFVLKIWAEEKFNIVPEEIQQYLQLARYDHIVLCTPDMPWEPDELRENPEDRDRLFKIYKDTLDKIQLTYLEVQGALEARLQTVLTGIKKSR